MSAKILASEKYMNDVSSCIYANWFQALKRKEENSIWGPVEMPTQGKSVHFLHNQQMPQKIDTYNIVTKPQIAEDILISGPCHQEINIEDNLKSNLVNRPESDVKNNEEDMCSDLSGLKTVTTENVYKDVNPGNSSKNPVYNANVKADTRSGSHNWCKGRKRDYKLSSSPTQTVAPVSKVMVTEIRNFSNTEPAVSKRECEGMLLESDVKDNEERMNSYLSDLITMTTENVYKDINPRNLSKNLGYNGNLKADMRSDFHNWCESRQRDYKLSPNQTVAPVSKGMVTKIQNFSNTEPAVNKNECGGILLESDEQNLFEYHVSYENNILKYDSCTTDKRVMCKTNLSHDKDDISVNLKQILNNIKKQTSEKEIDSCKHFNSKFQKGPEISEYLKTDEFSENNPQFPVEVSTEKNAMEFKDQPYGINPKTEVIEKVVLDESTKKTVCTDKNLEQTASSEMKEFNTKAHDKNEKQYVKKNACNPKFHQNLTYEIPPRFRKKMEEKQNISSEKQIVPKKVHPERKLLKEASLKTCQKKKENSDILVLSESKRKDNWLSGKWKSQICIRIADERCDKNFEFVTDSAVLSRIKKTSPKLFSDIPDVDSGPKELQYSADAMNIILRSVFCRSYKIVMPPAVTGVEVLAAAQTWQLHSTDFYKIFCRKFLQNVLTSTNAALVLSYANQYNLKEVVGACKDAYPAHAVVSTNTARKRTKKMPCVSFHLC